VGTVTVVVVGMGSSAIPIMPQPWPPPLGLKVAEKLVGDDTPAVEYCVYWKPEEMVSDENPLPGVIAPPELEMDARKAPGKNDKLEEVEMEHEDEQTPFPVDV
jgi:hypothetical protein